MESKITRTAALKICREILERAERERIEYADKEARDVVLDSAKIVEEWHKSIIAKEAKIRAVWEDDVV